MATVGKKPRQAELPQTRRDYGSGSAPETPSALRKSCARVKVSDSDRLHVGCALLIAARIEALELGLARVLDVLLKRTDVQAFQETASQLGKVLGGIERELNDARVRAVVLDERVARLETNTQAESNRVREAIMDDAADSEMQPPSTSSNGCGWPMCDAWAQAECAHCGRSFCERHRHGVHICPDGAECPGEPS